MFLTACIAGFVLSLQISYADDAVNLTIDKNMRIKLVEETNSHEVLLHEIVKSAVSKKQIASAGGAKQFLTGVKFRPITIRKAALQSLEKSINLRVSKMDASKAEDLMQEAKAVFDPVLNASVSYSHNDKNTRSLLGSVFEAKRSPIFDTFTLQFNVITIPIKTPNAPDPQVVQLGYRPANGDKLFKEIFANEASEFGPTRTTNFSFGLSQQLANGGSYSITQTTKHQRVNYGVTTQGGRLHFNVGAPWSSTVQVNLTMPLPKYGKGQGELSKNNISVVLTEKQKETSFWVIKNLINNILLSVDLAYWDLVSTYEKLSATIENTKRVQEQSDKIKILFERGQITRFGKAQIDTTLAQAKIQEEQAWLNLVNASQRLGNLIENDQKEITSYIYAPIDYYENLDKFIDVKLDEAIAQGIKLRPDLHLQKVVKNISHINKLFAEDQTRWDINMGGSWLVKQDGSQYGYKSANESFEQLHDPDQVNQAYSIDFSRAIGNRSAIASYKKSIANDTGNHMDLENIKADITNDIKNSISTMLSLRQRIKLNLESENMVMLSYKKLLRRRDVGADTTELELIISLKNLLNAKLTIIQSYIDQRKAESRLLTANGTISNRYVERNMKALDRNRVRILADNHMLKYFLPIQ